MVSDCSKSNVVTHDSLAWEGTGYGDIQMSSLTSSVQLHRATRPGRPMLCLGRARSVGDALGLHTSGRPCCKQEARCHQSNTVSKSIEPAHLPCRRAVALVNIGAPLASMDLIKRSGWYLQPVFSSNFLLSFASTWSLRLCRPKLRIRGIVSIRCMSVVCVAIVEGEIWANTCC